ncbi:MAG: glycosyltransferase [Chloroflexota bacterium]|nr:glycosyltransferase [Chloroflexota bacterium]
MSSGKTRDISVIIPSPPGVYPAMVLESLRHLKDSVHNIEIFVVEGKQPARQRNEAISKAKGEILFFFDDDVTIHPDVVDNMLRHYDDKDVAVVGGPNLTPENDSRLQKYFGLVMASKFGCASMSTRYKQEGEAREGDENSLILCNLSIRRSVIEKDGAFNEGLWPNEENELLHRLQTQGWKLIYEPQAVVYHSRRPTLKAHAKQLFGYGRGRLEQTFIQPSSFSPLFLLPTLFVVYLLLLPFAELLIPVPEFLRWGFLVPGMSYVGLCLATAVKSAWDEKDIMSFFWLLLLIPLTHISYGLGFIYGVYKKLRGGQNKKTTEVYIWKCSLDSEPV